MAVPAAEPFTPDARLTSILTTATAAGELMAQADSFAKRFAGTLYRPDRRWDLTVQMTNSAQRGEGYEELLERSGDALLVADRLRRRHPLPDRQRPTAR